MTNIQSINGQPKLFVIIQLLIRDFLVCVKKIFFEYFMYVYITKMQNNQLFFRLEFFNTKIKT